MKTALLFIDVQKGFQKEHWGQRNHPQAEEEMLLLLDHFRQTQQEVIHVRHRSQLPQGSFYKESGRQFMDGFEPLSGEAVFEKTVNSAFIGTQLEDYLRSSKISQLVIAGLTLPHCVSTTPRMAAHLGFEVILLSDATATFALPDLSGQLIEPELLHQIHLATLQDEFAEIQSTEDYLMTSRNTSSRI